MRREKISERTKMLQSLVPGCDKVTGKALMLDEIISYVQSLQSQIECLAVAAAREFRWWPQWVRERPGALRAGRWSQRSGPELLLLCKVALISWPIGSEKNQQSSVLSSSSSTPIWFLGDRRCRVYLGERRLSLVGSLN